MKIDNGTLLQGGKYEILQILGEGGFGITYLAIQKSLNRKVAIKEFFMKNYCQRDSETTIVHMGTDSSHSMIELYKKKFIKEAQTIAQLQNNHVIRIFDVFEENGTAYYVMEHLTGGDLSERIPKGGMDEQQALSYIYQIAEALDYIHQNNVLHLDVKPDNILFRNENMPVLIDFGISKHYNIESGGATSDTPIGISKGYAPIEQHEPEGIKEISPATDIYALGATFFHLLTGQRPPSASWILNAGLPALPVSVSAQSIETIKKAMKPIQAERIQDIQSFLSCLPKPKMKAKPIEKSEETEKKKVNQDVSSSSNFQNEVLEKKEQVKAIPERKTKKLSAILCAIIAIIIIALAAIIVNSLNSDNNTNDKIQEIELKDTLAKATGTKQLSPKNNKEYNEGEVIKPSFTDLGLSVLWANSHIGEIEDMLGTYFGWGSTLTSSCYDITHCSTWEMDLKNISGNDNFDAATKLYGEGYRIPTRDEMQELIDKCQWSWTTKGGLKGYLVTGANGNSIFLAAWGHRANKERMFLNERGYYQTADSDNDKSCWILQFDEKGMKMAPSMRYQGNIILAVKDK